MRTPLAPSRDSNHDMSYLCIVHDSCVFGRPVFTGGAAMQRTAAPSHEYEALLAATRELPAWLGLGGNGIGEAGATAIAPHMPQALQTLDLYDNEIGAAGATAIASRPPAAPASARHAKIRTLRH